MKRITGILQIVALALTALFVVSLFASSFPPWSGDDEDGGEAAATTVEAADTTAGGGDTTVQGANTTAANAVAGEALYNDECASCHDEDGSGGLGPSLLDLTASFPDPAEVTVIIRDGIGSMPGFGGDLSAEEIDAIVAYIYTFS